MKSSSALELSTRIGGVSPIVDREGEATEGQVTAPDRMLA